MPQYALIADDLTGALDAGAGFAAAGLRAVVPLSGLASDAAGADVVLINTDSREGSASNAASAAREAAEQLRNAGIERVYKKIDSVLRGHPGTELAAVLDVYRGRALVAPAFPAQGRVTRQGIQYVNGERASPFGGFLRDALEIAASRCDLRDAETDYDLERIAHEAAGNAAYRVWCGTAGLARHIPAALGLTSSSRDALPQVPVAKRVLVLAGTGHSATNAQLDALAAERIDGVEILVEGRRESSEEHVYSALKQAAANAHIDAQTALILTGGESALIVCRELGATAIEVAGEALPGIPIGLLMLPSLTVTVATKSGGFGTPDVLVVTVKRLLGDQTPV